MSSSLSFPFYLSLSLSCPTLHYYIISHILYYFYFVIFKFHSFITLLFHIPWSFSLSSFSLCHQKHIIIIYIIIFHIFIITLFLLLYSYNKYHHVFFHSQNFSFYYFYSSLIFVRHFFHIYTYSRCMLIIFLYYTDNIIKNTPFPTIYIYI